MAKQPHPIKSTHVDPRMLVELATNLEPEQIVADRYGYNVHELANLKSQSWFQRSLKEAEQLVESSFPFQKRMAVLAESLTLHLYEKTLETDSMPAKIEATKLFTKLAALEPVPNSNSKAEAFTITINLGDNLRGAPETLVVQHTPQLKTIDHEPSLLNDDLFSDFESEVLVDKVV